MAYIGIDKSSSAARASVVCNAKQMLGIRNRLLLNKNIYIKEKSIW